MRSHAVRCKIGKLITLAAVFLFSACADVPPQTIHERLAEAKPQERTRTARNICLTEAEWRRDRLISWRIRHYGAARAPYNIPRMPDVIRLEDICWEMTKVFNPLNY